MKRFVIVDRKDDFSQEKSAYIKEKLLEQGFIEDCDTPQLVIVVGGDGTMLHAFQAYKDQLDRVAFVGIHSGTLGFATDYTTDDIDQFLEDVKHAPEIEAKTVLKAVVYKEGRPAETIVALNEIRVENIIRTQRVDVLIDGLFLETFQGNGLCISNQHGSTAYNRSLGGAIVFPDLKLFQISEISGIHHRFSRSVGSSIILSDRSVITLEDAHFDDAYLCYDHLNMPLSGSQCIVITRGESDIRFAHFKPIPHVQRLQALF